MDFFTSKWSMLNSLRYEVKNDSSYHTHQHNRKSFHIIPISSMTFVFVNIHPLGKLLQFLGPHWWHWLDIPSLLKSEPTTTLPNSLNSHLFQVSHKFSFKKDSTPHFRDKKSTYQRCCKAWSSSHLMKLIAHSSHQEDQQHEKHAIW